MTEISFYRCRKRKEAVLLSLLEKGLEQQSRMVVRTKSLSELDRFLWSYRDDSFLPHGCKHDGMEAHQPIWLTDGEENPNAADILIVLDGAPFDLDGFGRCLYLFDGEDEAACQSALADQQRLSAEHKILAWQQTDRGWAKDEA